jgi:hypothetical protein
LKMAHLSKVMAWGAPAPARAAVAARGNRWERAIALDSNRRA